LVCNRLLPNGPALTLSLSRRAGEGGAQRRVRVRVDFARRLRRDATHAEALLWSRLRNRRLGGHKFRRQHPIGRYIVDFVWIEQRLVIEVDGGQHAALRAEDARRTAWLQSRGFRVLRFWNNEVLANLEAVLTAIDLACAHFDPLPRGGSRP
jgi:very-short-patch-repair endonuclease